MGIKTFTQLQLQVVKGGRYSRQRMMRLFSVLLVQITIGLACLGCGGSDDDGPAPEGQIQYRLVAGSMIEAGDPNGNVRREALSGSFTVSEVLPLAASAFFDFGIVEISLRSRDFNVEGTDGFVRGIRERHPEPLVFYAPVLVNGVPLELRGSGGPETFPVPDLRRPAPDEFRGVVVTGGEYTLTLYANRVR